MRIFLALTKALNDQTRLRTLLALRQGELCLCQLVELFSLAPSTISRHLNVLYEAGLVDRRREGRWAYFKLAGRNASPEVRRALSWVTASLKDEEQVISDQKKLCCVQEMDLQKLCECYK